MRIKSYFAGTVEAAMDRARRELGEEAVLLHAHPAPPEARHLGIHEVVFGVEDLPAESVPATPPPLSPHAEVSLVAASSLTASSLTASSLPASRVTARQAAAHQEPAYHASASQVNASHVTANHMTANHMTANHVAAGPVTARHVPAGQAPAEVDRKGTILLAEFLEERGFPGWLARNLAQEATEEVAAVSRLESDRFPLTGDAEGRRPNAYASNAHPSTAEFRRRGPVADVLIRLLSKTVVCQPVQPTPGRILAVSGPPGSGKTSMLVKLAASWSLAADATTRGARVVMLSTDTNRIAAAEQLRACAMILDVPCEVLETPLALDRAIVHFRRKEPQSILLIDNPGWSPSQLQATSTQSGEAQTGEAQPWMAFFASHSEIEHHLTVAATMGEHDLAAAAARFAPFCVSRLMLTRADELTAGGSLAAALRRTGLPVSCWGRGQSIPEDWEPATLPGVVELFLRAPAHPTGRLTSGSARPDDRRRGHRAHAVRATQGGGVSGAVREEFAHA